MRGVVRKVLGDAARDGLIGDHHYYISFDTRADGVRLSNRLREKYPKEMTIVVQHQYWELGVTDHAFEIGLSFDRVPERLLIPFQSMTGFFDPSVQFGVKFETATHADEDELASDTNASPTAEPVSIKTGKLAPRRKPASIGNDDTQGAPQPALKLEPRKSTAPKSDDTKPSAKTDQPPDASAAVVSLDAFRKKK